MRAKTTSRRGAEAQRAIQIFLSAALRLCVSISFASLAVGCAHQTLERTSGEQRVVSVGTAATETITALGAAPRLVGVDNASADYFPEVSNLPKVGPRNALSAEGILSLRPTLVVATAEAGPPAVLDQLRGAGVAVVTLAPTYTPETVEAGIRDVARALGAEARGDELAKTVDRELADARAMLAAAGPPPKVIFVGRGPNMPNATMSGAGTTIDEMISLAGGSNPMRDFTGFREMTDEAVVAAAPDVILMTERSFERSGGVEGVLKFPGVSLTPAGRDRRVVTVSDVYFQGFGPGLGRAVRDLAVKLHPELKQG